MLVNFLMAVIVGCSITGLLMLACAYGEGEHK